MAKANANDDDSSATACPVHSYKKTKSHNEIQNKLLFKRDTVNSIIFARDLLYCIVVLRPR